MGYTVPAKTLFLAFTSCFAFTMTPGKVGEVVRAFILRDSYDIPVARTTGILMTERLGDLMAVTLLACCGLLMFSNLRIYFFLVLILIAIAILLLTQAKKLKRQLFPTQPTSKAGRLAEAGLNALEAGGALLSPRPLLIGIFLSITAWSCEALALHILFVALNYHFSLPTSVSVFALSTLAGALSMLPGGVGGMEVVMFLILTQLHMPHGTATFSIVYFRFMSLWLFNIIGIAAMFIWLLKHKGPSRARSGSGRAFPLQHRVRDVTAILPVINETYSLQQTVEGILTGADTDICEILIVIAAITTPESLKTIATLQDSYPDLIRVHRQKMKFLGGAMREAFDLARGSHVIMMASDLETDPSLVPELIAQEKARPNAIITVTRWHGGARFQGYNPVKLLANAIFQKIFALLYGTKLSDMTYAYRIFPTALVQAIRWEEIRHPLLFETVIKPLRLGVEVREIPGAWHARTEGESQNTFWRNFLYFRIGLRVRFSRRESLLRNACRDAVSPQTEIGSKA